MSNKKLSDRLTEVQKKEIRRLYFEENKSSKEISKMFPVYFNSVSRIVKGHKSEYVSTRKERGSKKLNSEKAKQIIIISLKGLLSQKEIAEMYNVDQSTISRICTGDIYKNIFQKLKKDYKKEIIILK